MSLDIRLADENDNGLEWWNCTHNLIPMAEAVGLYRPLWHGDEDGTMSKKQREASPPAFAALMVALARRAGEER